MVASLKPQSPVWPVGFTQTLMGHHSLHSTQLRKQKTELSGRLSENPGLLLQTVVFELVFSSTVSQCFCIVVCQAEGELRVPTESSDRTVPPQ